MNSSRPYLIRALYAWIVDNEHTPYLLVNAVNQDVVKVPREHIQEGRIVLNISPTAVNSLDLGNEYITFNARFRGISREIIVPVAQVLAIYASENNQGMMFTEDRPSSQYPSKADKDRPETVAADKMATKHTLKLIK